MYNYMVTHESVGLNHVFYHPTKTLDKAVEVFAETLDKLREGGLCVRNESRSVDDYYRSVIFDEAGDLTDILEVVELESKWM